MTNCREVDRTNQSMEAVIYLHRLRRMLISCEVCVSVSCHVSSSYVHWTPLCLSHLQFRRTDSPERPGEAANWRGKVSSPVLFWDCYIQTYIFHKCFVWLTVLWRWFSPLSTLQSSTTWWPRVLCSGSCADALQQRLCSTTQVERGVRLQ